MKKGILTLILVMIFSRLLFAGQVTSGLVALSECMSIRLASMGNVLIIPTYDSASCYQVSAGLGFVNNMDLSFSYYQGFVPGSSYIVSSFLKPLKRGAFNLTLFYYDAGMEEVFDSNGDSEGIIDFEKDTMVALGYGFVLPDLKELSLGLSTKFITTTLVEKYSSSVHLFDLSLLLSKSEYLIGAKIENFVNNGIKYLKETDTIPTNWYIGLAYENQTSKYNALYSITLKNLGEISIGTEYYPDKNKSTKGLCIRLGYRTAVYGKLNEFNVGLGADFKEKYHFDYGAKIKYMSLANFLVTRHMFSVSYRF